MENPISEDAILAFRNQDVPLGYRLVSDPVRDDLPIPLREPQFEMVADDIDYSLKVVDRLRKPQFGYRALHFVVGYRSRYMEIQVRTRLQHAWAELSEKAADKYGHELKYGNGNAAILNKLMDLSRDIAAFEELEFQRGVDYLDSDDNLSKEFDLMRQDILDTIRSEALSI